METDCITKNDFNQNVVVWWHRQLFLFFSGCPPSHYGLFCNQSCPENCNGPCDLDTGKCIFGCLNGWHGDKCEQGIPTFFLFELQLNDLMSQVIKVEIQNSGVPLPFENITCVFTPFHVYLVFHSLFKGRNCTNCKCTLCPGNRLKTVINCCSDPFGIDTIFIWNFMRFHTGIDSY